MNIGLIIQKNVKRSTGQLVDRFLKPKPVTISQTTAPQPSPAPSVTTPIKPSLSQPPIPRPAASLSALLTKGPVGEAINAGFKKITREGATKLRLTTKKTTAKLFKRLFPKSKPMPPPQLPITPEPFPAPPVASLPRELETPVPPLSESAPLPPLTIRPKSRQEPPPLQPPSQNPMVSFFTRLGKNAIERIVKASVKKIAVDKLIPKLTKPKKAIVPPLEAPRISPTPPAISQPEPSRPQPSPVSLFTSLGKRVIGKAIKTGVNKIATSRLIGGITARAAGFLSGAAGTIGSLFSGLTTISLPATLPAAGVGGALAIVVLITIIVVMIVGGAFQKGQGGQISNFGNPLVARPPSSISHLGEAVIWTLNQCGVTAVNKNTWAKTETCLRSSNLANKEALVAQFRFSVFEVGSGLQCVGFVRGIMAALGKDPGGGRDAKDYLNPPPPTGYQPLSTNLQDTQIGDLIIMRGSNDGHIAIVIEKNAGSIKVAQAWGTSGGAIQITEVNPIYFDGFLRPL